MSEKVRKRYAKSQAPIIPAQRYIKMTEHALQFMTIIHAVPKRFFWMNGWPLLPIHKIYGIPDRASGSYGVPRCHTDLRGI